MSATGAIVLKIGGAAAEDADAALDVAGARRRAGEPVIVVHGGGPLVGEWAARFGIETRFERGLRVTDEPTRDVALAVLTGLVNKRLVAALAKRGIAAVGISGADGGMLAVKRAEASLGLVGEIVGVHARVLFDLVESGAVPIVAPAAIDASGELVNVNADAVAGAIAVAVRARLLVFVTDVAGVKDATGRVLATLDPATAHRLRREGVVSGGMIPKIDACLVASGGGCVAAIVHARDRAGLEALVAGRRAGTVVEPVSA